MNTVSALPSGRSVDWRVRALAIAASAVMLPVAVVGYVGIAAAVQLLRRVRRR